MANILVIHCQAAGECAGASSSGRCQVCRADRGFRPGALRWAVRLLTPVPSCRRACRSRWKGGAGSAPTAGTAALVRLICQPRVQVWSPPAMEVPESKIQNHRIPAWQGLAGPSVGHPVQPPAEAGSPRAGCTGPFPGGCWISPEKEIPGSGWLLWISSTCGRISQGLILTSGGTGVWAGQLNALCWALGANAALQLQRVRCVGGGRGLRLQRGVFPEKDPVPELCLSSLNCSWNLAEWEWVSCEAEK